MSTDDGLLTDVGAFEVSGEPVMVNGRWDGGGTPVLPEAVRRSTDGGNSDFGTSSGSGTA